MHSAKHACGTVCRSWFSTMWVLRVELGSQTWQHAVLHSLNHHASLFPASFNVCLLEGRPDRQTPFSVPTHFLLSASTRLFLLA